MTKRLWSYNRLLKYRPVLTTHNPLVLNESYSNYNIETFLHRKVTTYYINIFKLMGSCSSFELVFSAEKGIFFFSSADCFHPHTQHNLTIRWRELVGTVELVCGKQRHGHHITNASIVSLQSIDRQTNTA